MEVLLVEDNPARAALLIETIVNDTAGGIDGEDIHIVECSGLRSAFVHLASDACDVVAISLCLPDGSGSDCVRRLKMFKPGLPVIVLVDHPDAKRDGDILRLGADDVLPVAILPPECITRALRHAVIRERRLVAQELAAREAEQRLRVVVDQVPEALLVVDRRNRVLLANAAAAGLFGRPVRELVGSGFPYIQENGASRWEISDGRAVGRLVTPRWTGILWNNEPAQLVILALGTEAAANVKVV